MITLSAKKVVKIWGTVNAWSLASESNASEPSTECETCLEIQGDDKNGYHLVMSPEGFFTADYWFKTKEEAIESAEELFGVTAREWSKKEK